MTKENEELRARNTTLERRTVELAQRIVRQEQYSRNLNLEIQGVEVREKESVESIAAEIGRLIEEPISSSDLEARHRVPTRKPDKTLLCNLNRAPNVNLSSKRLRSTGL